MGETTSNNSGEGGTSPRDTGEDPGLSTYLNDHLAGSAGALQLAKRLREEHGPSDLGRYLADLVAEIEEDRGVLQRVMLKVGAKANPVKQAGALGAEFLTRLKHHVSVISSGSAVARLEEVEILSLGIAGKQLLWRLLGELADSDERLQEFDFSALTERAEVQRDGLEPFRTELGTLAFSAESRPPS